MADTDTSPETTQRGTPNSKNGAPNGAHAWITRRSNSIDVAAELMHRNGLYSRRLKPLPLAT